MADRQKTDAPRAKNGESMKILVVDAQGGGIGRTVIASLREKYPEADLTAVGTNAAATAAMLRAGADRAATGENAVVVCARRADVIIGPLGIVIADALLGEITPRMATAIGESGAVRLLIPVNQCNNIVVGVPDTGLSVLVAAAVAQVGALLAKNEENC